MINYPSTYWKDCYSNKIGNEDFVEGIIVALFTFAIWRDGVQRIGSMETPIHEIIREVHTQLLPKKESPDG